MSLKLKPAVSLNFFKFCANRRNSTGSTIACDMVRAPVPTAVGHLRLGVSLKNRGNLLVHVGQGSPPTIIKRSGHNGKVLPLGDLSQNGEFQGKARLGPSQPAGPGIKDLSSDEPR